jgi:hypothetical protein
VRGEAEAKLIAALTKHHQYADGSCLNLEPVGNNELARIAEVSESTFRGDIQRSGVGVEAIDPSSLGEAWVLRDWGTQRAGRRVGLV